MGIPGWRPWLAALALGVALARPAAAEDLVVLRDGHRFAGRVAGFAADVLSLTDSKGAQRRLSRRQVATITLDRARPPAVPAAPAPANPRRDLIVLRDGRLVSARLMRITAERVETESARFARQDVLEIAFVYGTGGKAGTEEGWGLDYALLDRCRDEAQAYARRVEGHLEAHAKVFTAIGIRYASFLRLHGPVLRSALDQLDGFVARARMSREDFKAQLVKAGHAGRYSEAVYRRAITNLYNGALVACIGTYRTIAGEWMGAMWNQNMEVPFWAAASGLPPRPYAAELRLPFTNAIMVQSRPLRYEVRPNEAPDESGFDPDIGLTWGPDMVYRKAEETALARYSEVAESDERTTASVNAATARYCRDWTAAYRRWKKALASRYRAVSRGYGRVGAGLLRLAEAEIRAVRRFAAAYLEHLVPAPPGAGRGFDYAGPAKKNWPGFTHFWLGGDQRGPPNLNVFLADQKRWFTDQRRRATDYLAGQRRGIARLCGAGVEAEPKPLAKLDLRLLTRTRREIEGRLDDDLTAAGPTVPFCPDPGAGSGLIFQRAERVGAARLRDCVIETPPTAVPVVLPAGGPPPNAAGATGMADVTGGAGPRADSGGLGGTGPGSDTGDLGAGGPPSPPPHVEGGTGVADLPHGGPGAGPGNLSGPGADTGNLGAGGPPSAPPHVVGGTGVADLPHGGPSAGTGDLGGGAQPLTESAGSAAGSGTAPRIRGIVKHRAGTSTTAAPEAPPPAAPARAETPAPTGGTPGAPRIRGIVKHRAGVPPAGQQLAAGQGSTPPAPPAGGYAAGRAAFLKGDYGGALTLWRPAAEAGDPAAQNGLGVLYLNGLGVAKDEAKGLAWIRKAAAAGNAKAQCNLGAVYAEGVGVPKDDATAVKWYRQSAEQGFAKAQHALGLAYQNGRGVAVDQKAAVAWYEKAARQGYPDAQLSLGMAYMMMPDAGGPKDAVTAYMWMTLALKQGLESAAGFRSALALMEKLSDADKARAERMAADWKPGKAAD